MRQAKYSSQVQQRPLTAASHHDRQHTGLVGTAAKRPGAPLVRDEEAAVPAAYPPRCTWLLYGTLPGTAVRASLARSWHEVMTWDFCPL